MVNLKLFGINEVEVVTTALFEYHTAMLRSGNVPRASLVLDLLDRLNSSAVDCCDDCEKCSNFFNLKECGYETKSQD